jgi:hypothetical protein
LVFTLTTEAEYVALCKASKYFIYVKTAMVGLSFQDICMALFCDNRSTIDLAKNYSVSELFMHIIIHHYHVRELVHHRTVLLIYFPMIYKLSDMYTKGLCEVQLSKLYRIALGFT